MILKNSLLGIAFSIFAGLNCSQSFNTTKDSFLEGKVYPPILKVEKLQIDLSGKRMIETRFCYMTPSCKNMYGRFDFELVNDPQSKQCKIEQVIGKFALERTVRVYKDEITKKYGRNTVHIQVFYEESTKNVCTVLYWDSELIKEL